MKQLGSTIECYRGESFVVKREFIDEDGAPLALGNGLKNPFVRFTVSSNTFKIDGAWKKNYWLDIGDWLRTDFRNALPFPENCVPSLAIASKIHIGNPYYIINGNSNREYYVYDAETNSYIKYTFVVQKRFLNNDTKKWIGQIYQYEIALCSGKLMTEWLKEVFQTLYPNTIVPNANSELAHYICKKRPDLLEGVNINEPLVSYTTNRVLQGPCKLIVKEN